MERIEIAGTPFQMVGNEEQGYFAAMGKYRVTKPMKTKEEVLDYIETNMWLIIVNIATIIAEGTYDMKQATQNFKN